MVFKRRFQNFQGSIKSVSRKSQGYFKIVPGRLKGVSKEFERNSENFREVSNVFQGGFKEVSRVFQETFYGASRKLKRCFFGVLNGV